MRSHPLAVGLLAAVAFAAGCEKSAPQPPLVPPQPASRPRPSTPAPSPSESSPPAAAPNGASVSVLGVTVTLPAGWKRNPPANQMRLAEVEVPDPSGDPARACVAVFSTAGGSVEENITRWAGQMLDAQGQPAAFTSQSRAINGVRVTTVEMSGTFVGMGAGAPQPDSRLHGAIIEAPEGLLFIKMTGPAAPMTAAGAAFHQMIDSVTRP